MSAPYLGDFVEDETVHFTWSSNDGDGASITRATDGTVSVYKDNGVTQSVAGVTDTEDFDSLTGIHACTIDLSADAFYATGANYSVILSAATIDGQTVNAVLAHFSIENRFNEVDVTKIGGGAQSATDLKDFADAGYDPATKKVQGVVLTDTVTTLTNKTGFSLAATGLDAISQAATGMVEIAKAIWDRVLTGGTHNIATSAGRRLRSLQDSGVYDGGFIYIDTVNGAAGTTDYENGTVNNPVDSIADALTLAGSLNFKKLYVYSGSSVTFAASMAGYTLDGQNYSIALGGQSAANATINNAAISGTASGSGAEFFNCTFAASASTGPATFINCGFNTPTGTPYVANGNGEYVLVRCYSLVAGSGTPFFDFSGTGAASGINIRGWFGGTNITLDSDNTLSLEVVAGGGQTITTGGADCEIRGTMRALTVVLSAAETVQFVGITGPIALSGTTTATVNLYGVAGAVTDTTSAATVTNTTVSQENIGDVVWDETLADHLGAGSTGNALNAAGAAGDPWSTALPGAYGAGTAGKIVGDNVDAPISTVDTVVDAIKAVTDNLPDSGALTTIGTDTARLTAVRAAVLTDWIDGGRLDLLLDAIKAVTDNLPDSGALTTIGTDTARLTAARAGALTDWINGGRLDLLLDAIKVITDALGATAAANLALSASNAGIVSGTAQTGTLSTTQMSTDLSETTNDHYIGRTIIWLTGALAGQGSDITDYVGTNGVLTFTAVTEAPSNADTFIIV